MEIALTTIARKLRLRTGIVTLHGAEGGRVLTVVGGETELERDGIIRNEDFFCSMLNQPGQLLAIDYASLSEWRKHPACRVRGLESYIGVHCGEQDGMHLVVSFFDPVPRDRLFSANEKTLVEQVGPWIAAMAIGNEEDFVGAAEEGFDYPMDINPDRREA